MAMKNSNLIYFPNQEKLKKYEEKGVYFTKPLLVAFYEYNYGKITHSKRINYYKNPTDEQYPLDLNVDLLSYRRREPEMYSKHIELSLKYCMSSSAQNSNDMENVEKTKVITRCGTLVKIMAYYYSRFNNDDLIVRVLRYNGNLYMVKEEYDGSKDELKSAHTHHQRLNQLLFSDSLCSSPNINEPCDENICFYGVHRSIFGKYDIIYSGEIQGILAEEEFKDFDDLDALNDCRFVFVKQLWKNFRNKANKYLNYWLQAYLCNVKEIYIGYKTNDGIIDQPLELNYVKDLPKNCDWKPAICTGFLYEFLQNIENRMSSVNSLSTVYEFHFNRKYKTIKYEIFKGNNDKTIITKEYMKFCKEI